MGYYGYYGRSASSSIYALGVCMILAVIGGIVLYFTFLSKKNENKLTGFLGWLYDFLSFKILIVEAILKVLYLIVACFMTLGGFVLLFSSFGAGFFMMTLGNIAARIAYEFLLILILICKNTSEINKKMSGHSSNDASDMFVTSIELPKKADDEKTSAPSKTTVAPTHTSAPTAAPQTSTLFCPKCGNKVNAEDDFCSNCGSKLN